MAGVKERLVGLLALASQRRWTALTNELTDLALDWPADWPDALRVPVLALLQCAAREADEATRQNLASRLGGNAGLPLRLLNELYLDAPAPVRRVILMRDELESDDDEETPAVDAAGLLAAARQDTLRDFAAVMSEMFRIPHHASETILADASGEPLAVLCRGSGVDRATFTALALLRSARELPLSVFDTVPDRAARHIAGYWRAHAEPPAAMHIQAAE